MGTCLSTNSRSEDTLYEVPREVRGSTSSLSRVPPLGKRFKSPPINGPPGPASGLQDTGTLSDSILMYMTIDDQRVCIKLPINPWIILGPTSPSTGEIKEAFRRIIGDPKLSREKRAYASIANHILTSTAPRYYHERGTDLYTIRNPDHFHVAAYGDTEELARMIEINASLINAADEHGRTLLYLACKSGFYDMVEMLLKKGAEINKTQSNGSTPLHAASYFGHPQVVNLLLLNGARTDIQHHWGDMALKESATAAIEDLIKNASKDPVPTLTRELKEKKLVSRVVRLLCKKKVIAIELIRNPQVCDSGTRKILRDCAKEWELTWHGTRFDNLKSILKRGLVPSGTDGIKPPSNHHPLDEEYNGKENWAAAIFVSPSIWYAADGAYAEKVISQDEEWRVLIKTYCKPGSYDQHDTTIFGYTTRREDESSPRYSEYRVRNDEETMILRVESERNVVVSSVVFIRVSALKDKSIGFEEMTKIFKH